MARILALDFGVKRIGTAVSDETETFAFPRPAIARQEGHRRDMAAIRQLVERESIDEIVVGMPIMLSGERGVQAEKTEAFVEMLTRFVRVPIHTQDERMSTSEADKLMISADVRRAERTQAVDSMAASLILQSFLERRRSTAPSQSLGPVA